VCLIAMGLDGVVLSWVNDEAELAYWISDVLPVMEHAGYRLHAHATDLVGARHRGALPRSWLKVHLDSSF
jgi:hypothetical protein